MARRYLALVFPRLATERWQRRDAPPGLFAVVGPAHAPEIACLTAEAEAAGLARGMRLADARAVQPALVTRPHDPRADETALAQLARWALRYSPLAAPAPPDTVLLDTTGASHLFGGEEALLAEIPARLGDLRLTALAGLADTAPAAEALARFRPGSIAAQGETRRAIGPLPVEAIRLEGRARDLLRGLGLATVEEVMRLPRAAFARRFGLEAVAALDALTGARPAPISPQALTRPHVAALSFPEPIGLAADAMAGLARLLAQLCAQLETAQQGARRLRLTLQRTDQAALPVEIALARPSRDPALIARLFERPVGAADAGYGIDRMRLEALETEPLNARQQSSWRDREGEDALAVLLGSVGNRIGFERVTRFLPAESHIPDRAFTTAAAAYSEPAAWPGRSRPRPVAITRAEPVAVEEDGRPPTRFRWRRRVFTTESASGPERIAPEWWLDDPEWRSGPRDYWHVQTAEGDRLWLFHSPETGDWAVQGIFD